MAAILWGPIAGMLVQQRDKEPKWRAVPFEPDPAIKFDYEISMGLRKGEKQWKDTLDRLDIRPPTADRFDIDELQCTAGRYGRPCQF